MCVCACVCVYVCMFACTCINVISNVIFASPPPPQVRFGSATVIR